MLRASDYYFRKGPVCYVFTFYSKYRYIELSIFLLFLLLQDTRAYVHLLLLYIDLRQLFYFIIIYFKPQWNIDFLTIFESVLL